MEYDKDRKGFVTKDGGGLIRVKGTETTSVDIYTGDERKKGGHERDTIHIDTSSDEKKATIHSHNEDKSEKSSTDIKCYLTTACMRHYSDMFDDECYELLTLRWFRDNFVSIDDIQQYYKIAPIIVEKIEQINHNHSIYNYIYNYIISVCVKAIEVRDYQFAYERYKKSILNFEKVFLEV